MSSDSRRPLYTIRTVASVSRIQWRPGYDDEIASCALLTDSRIHVWDIRRPHIAKYVFDEHDTTPTGFESDCIQTNYLTSLKDSCGQIQMTYFPYPRINGSLSKIFNVPINRLVY